MECGREVLVEGIHLGGLVGTGAGSMSGPFLVPVREGLISHLQGVHDLGGGEGRVDGDKVGTEISGKVGPGTVISGGGIAGSFLAVFRPFAGRGAEFEMREGRGDVSVIVGEDGLIQIVIVVKSGPNNRCSNLS
jgi:hypothetical protein